MMLRAAIAFAIVWTATGVAKQAFASGNPERGAQGFRVCAACHSLRPGLSMTGPSLAGVWGRKAGTLDSFPRYSQALKASGVVWNEQSLDAWLTNPAKFVPDNHMTFPGIPSERDRADLIAFLHAVSEAGRGGPKVVVPTAYLATPINLKQLSPGEQVKAIRACRDTYYVETGDHNTRTFWDQSLRFKTDASRFGPLPGTPAILPAGMLGDRASIIFAQPQEISPFIQQRC